MYNKTSFIGEGICVLGIILALAFLCVALVYSPQGAESLAAEDVYEGEVVEKEITAASIRNESKYNILVSFEYEYQDEIRQGVKSFTVDKDVYAEVSIGDWFDSRTLTVTKPSGSPAATEEVG